MALNTNKGGLVSNTGHWSGDGVLGNGNSWGSGIAMSNGWGGGIAVSNGWGGGSIAVVSSITDGWGSNGSWVSDGWDGSNGLDVNIWLSSRVNLASGIVDVGLISWGSLTGSVMDVLLSCWGSLASGVMDVGLSLWV